MRSERCQQVAPRLVLPAQDLARLVESGTSTVQGLQDHAAAARETRRALQVRGRAVGVRSVLPPMIAHIHSFMLPGAVPAVVSAIFNDFAWPRSLRAISTAPSACRALSRNSRPAARFAVRQETDVAPTETVAINVIAELPS